MASLRLGTLMVFLSTPSARRATPGRRRAAPGGDISIHALCEEGDCPGDGGHLRQYDFYPRPLRGGRHLKNRRPNKWREFLSTPSARRATSYRAKQPTERGNFYPRPLRGGRQRRAFNVTISDVFLSTPSARRATLTRSQPSAIVLVFLSTPSARRATLFEVKEAKNEKFLSTPSARRATRFGIRTFWA